MKRLQLKSLSLFTRKAKRSQNTGVSRMVRRGGRARKAVRTVYRTARKTYSRGRRKGGFLSGGGKGGSIMHKTWESFKEGQAYGIVASKFAPQFQPIAQLYGEYKGGGFEGLLVNELFVNQLLGRPSALGGLGLNLGGLLGGGGGTMPPSGAV